MPHTGDYRIEAVGAAGGYDRRINSSQYRGRGARMIGTFRLNKGEVIQIIVGQEGGINQMGGAMDMVHRLLILDHQVRIFFNNL